MLIAVRGESSNTPLTHIFQEKCIDSKCTRKIKKWCMKCLPSTTPLYLIQTGLTAHSSIDFSTVTVQWKSETE
jgi:hypothetical protein